MFGIEELCEAASSKQVDSFSDDRSKTQTTLTVVVTGFLVSGCCSCITQLCVSKCCSRLSRVGGVYLYCSVVVRCLFSMIFGWAINCRCGTNVEWDALAHRLVCTLMMVTHAAVLRMSSQHKHTHTHTRECLFGFFIVWLFCVLCVSISMKQHKHKHSDYYLSGTRHTRPQQYYHHLATSICCVVSFFRVACMFVCITELSITLGSVWCDVMLK